MMDGFVSLSISGIAVYNAPVNPVVCLDQTHVRQGLQVRNGTIVQKLDEWLTDKSWMLFEPAIRRLGSKRCLGSIFECICFLREVCRAPNNSAGTTLDDPGLRSVVASGPIHFVMVGAFA